MTHLDRVSDTFDRWADEGRAESMEAGHRVTAGRALRELPLQRGDRLLDLGTGNGWAAREAVQGGARAVGVDVAPHMLQRARAAGGGVDLARASFDHLPFRGGSFDAAFSMEALYYAPDLDAALREVHRVLREDAPLVAVLDCYVENEASADWPQRTGLPMHRLREDAWVVRLREAGFRDVVADRLRAREGDVEDRWKIVHGSLRLRGRA